MSTRQSYSYLEEAQAEHRRQAELGRRQLRLAQDRAERAAAAHRQAAAAHHRARQGLASVERQSAAAASEAAATRQALGALERDLESSRAQLATAQQELTVEIDRVGRLESAAAAEAVEMAEAMRDAQHSLDAVVELAGAAAESVAELSPAEGERLQARQNELEESIRQLESEVRFLTQDAALAPASMVTLLAMESNGYRLRDTLTREGLVSYFERQGAAHQIAVRMAPAERRGEAVERWDLVAETFGLRGEDCLFEIEDFETAVEELELGDLVPGNRVYPKDDRGVRLAGGRRDASLKPLPRPRADLWNRRGGARPARRKVTG